MNLKTFGRILTAAILAVGCSSGDNRQSQTVAVGNDSDNETIFGLVCDGSNDTIVVYLSLPYTGSDPDTLNILEASRRRQVFGQLRIGDQVALYRNADDSTRADIVVVTQDLQGQWCYKVLPTLRHRADMEGLSEQQAISQLPDSVKALLSIEREYGLLIKNDSVAHSFGAFRNVKTSDEESPVVYPELQRYHQWLIYNGRLVLSETQVDSLGNVETVHADTAEFVELTPDTLVLRFADGEQGYYRKAETNE